MLQDAENYRHTPTFAPLETLFHAEDSEIMFLRHFVKGERGGGNI